MANVTTNPSVSANFFANLRASVSHFIENARKNQLHRTTVRELSSLTTRELDDLGIVRSEIPTIARKSVFGN